MQNDDHLGIIWQWGLYLMQQTHRKESSVTKTKQKLKKVSHKTEDFPSPITMVLILKHTQTPACMQHTSAQWHMREHFHTQAHTRAWPVSPLSTHSPSLCLFMATLALIPSHSISITSANSPILFGFSPALIHALASHYFIFFQQ